MEYNLTEEQRKEHLSNVTRKIIDYFILTRKNVLGRNEFERMLDESYKEIVMVKR